MSNEYPKLLYRPGTQEDVWGRKCDLLTVFDADGEKAAIEAGWALRPDEETARQDPLDHDGDGRKGGAPKGGNRRKREPSE